MADLGEMKNFYKDKRVLVTGHTGFKGAWLCRLLLDMGAKVYGYALAPERESLYGLLDWEKGLVSCYGDIRQPKKLGAFVKKSGAGSDFPSGGTAFGFCGICPASENL